MGVYIESGNEVKHLANVDEKDCALQCSLTEGCIAWTFRISSSQCWLKSDDSQKRKGKDWITGAKCGVPSKYQEPR